MLRANPRLAGRAAFSILQRLGQRAPDTSSNNARRHVGSVTHAGEKLQSTGVPKTQDSGSNIAEEQDRQTRDIIRRQRTVTNRPFIKNMFLGKFDTQMLSFPEILNQAELEDLSGTFDPINAYLEQVDSKSIDSNAELPAEIIQQLKDFGLFGLQIPEEYGGLGFNATQVARISEATALDASVSLTLTAHEAHGVKGILLMGSDDQKARYLPKLASGKSIAAFCLNEECSGSDAAALQTRATLSDDGKTYLLSGTKWWITNGGIADILTVFAKTKVQLPTGETVDKVTAFIVEKEFGGITTEGSGEKMGVRGSNTCTVHFNKTAVPVENVLGEVGGGFQVAVNTLNSSRYIIGSTCAGALRRQLKWTTEYVRKKEELGLESYRDDPLIQEKFGRIAMNIYAMESMTYLTAAMMDSYSQPDVSVEAAIIKVFSSEASWSANHEMLQIVGHVGLSKDLPYERCLRDSRVTFIFEGTNEILRLYIALMGLQHAGFQLRDTVKRLRDPLNNLGFMIGKWIDRMQTNKRRPTLNMKLFSHVHSSLTSCAEEFELSIVKLRYVVEKYLGTYADKLVNEQQSLKRFADIAVDLFAVTACLSRASRSAGVSLRTSEHELVLAKAFTCEALKRIDDNLTSLDYGEVVNGDINMREIADVMFKSGGYAAEHPLTRNW